MGVRRISAVLAGVLVLVAANASAQENGLRIAISSISDAAYPNANLIVNLEDSTGANTDDLTAEDVEVTVDGEPANVISVELATSEDAPLDLLLLTDTSGSMAGAPLTAAKSAAISLIDGLGPRDRVGIVNFGDEVTLALEFTEDRAAARDAINALVARGNTALYQATAVGAFSASSSAASRRVVILLSDGADFGGRSIATRDEALAAAAGSGVPWFTVAQGTDLDRAFLQELANRTNGRYLEAPRPGDLQALYEGIGKLLRSQYIITFGASGATAAEPVDVSITVTAGNRTSTATASYQPGPGFVPSISIGGLNGGEELIAPRDITVTIEPPGAAPRVAWYVDEVNVYELNAGPYVYTFDPARFDGGAHTLRVSVVTGGAPVEQSVTFSSVVPPSAGGGLPILPAVIVAVVVVIILGIVIVMKTRGAPPERKISADQRIKPLAAAITSRRAPVVADPGPDAEVVQESIGEVMGTLTSRSGPDLGREYQVGSSPVSIGSGARCGVRVKDPDLAPEEARIWVRNGHLMVHKMTKMSIVADGVSGGWSILESGDKFEIERHLFEFRLLDGAAATGPVEASEVPNILRDAAAEEERGRILRLADAHASDRPSENPPLRLSDLMPRDEGGFRPEEAAS